MIKPGELESLCKEQNEMSLSWSAIADRIRSQPEYNADQPRDITQLAKVSSEVHLDLCLEELARRHPEFNIFLNPEQLKEGNRRDHIIRYGLDGRLLVRSKSNPEWHEYDRVILVGDTAVVYEIKVTQWHKSRKSTSRGSPRSGRGIQNSLRPEVYYKRLEPIAQIFRSDVAYVMVIPKDIYSERVEPITHPVCRQFMENNGILVSIPMDRYEFRTGVLNMAFEHGFKVNVNVGGFSIYSSSSNKIK